MIDGKTLLLLLSALQVTAGCGSHEKSSGGTADPDSGIQINGKLEGGSGTRIYLDEMGAREFIPIDTTECDGAGTFQFIFSAERTAFYVLRPEAKPQITLLLEPGEKMTFNGSVLEGSFYSIEGSPGSQLLCELSTEHRKTLNALGEISRQNVELMGEPDFASIKMELDRKFDSVMEKFRDYSLRFIQTNSESLAILIALYNLYGQGLPVFNPGTDLEVYQYVDSVLQSRYRGFEAVDLLHAQMAEATMAGEEHTHLKGIQTGQFAPDFVSSRPDGSMLALSELRGNYVLISFWAGWSRLSREENITLKQAASAFQEFPFRILQVSLDDSKKEWTEAIGQDGLTWDQLSDLLRWDSPVANLYRIEKIPSNVLVDPDGRVVDTDLLGNRLIEKLESIFRP